MTYNVFGGMLNPAQLSSTQHRTFVACEVVTVAADTRSVMLGISRRKTVGYPSAEN